jgi:hypothetical protein
MKVVVNHTAAAANHKAVVWDMEFVGQAAPVMLDGPTLELVARILAGVQATKAGSGLALVLVLVLVRLAVVDRAGLAGFDAACCSCSIPADVADVAVAAVAAVAGEVAVAAGAAVTVSSTKAAAIFS